MDELKTHIEDIVAPIPAAEIHKNKYRQELFAHLSELYAEELSRTEDAGEAAKAALARLGDPESLRTEFMKDVSPFTLLQVRIERFFAKPPGRSPWRHAARNGAIVFGLYSLAVYGLLMPLVAMGGNQPADMQIAAAAFGVVMGLVLAVFLMAVDLLQAHTRTLLHAEYTRLRTCVLMVSQSSVAAIAIWGVAFGALWGEGLLLGQVFGPDHPSTVMLAAVRGPFAFRFVAFLAAMAFVIPPAMALERRQNGHIPDWPYAE